MRFPAQGKVPLGYPAAMKTAALVIIGNEILSGQTQDRNGPFLARRLGELGVRVAELRAVRDDEPAIVAAINELRASCDYVLATGGIGPTHDDITAAAIAKAFGVAHAVHPRARALLAAKYGADLNAARLRMATVPAGAELIDNPISTAPGFVIGNVYVFAGVPEIMQAMFEGARHRIAGGPPVRSRTVLATATEGVFADQLAAVQAQHRDVEIGSYPSFGRAKVETRIVMRSTDAARIDAAAAAVENMFRALAVPAVSEPGSAP